MTGRGFETKHTQPIEYIGETAKSTSTRNGSKLPCLEGSQLGLEVRNSQVGRGEFAGAVKYFLLQHLQPMRGVAQGVELLAELVDLAGPAGLVGFLAVFGETGTFERRGELRLQFGEVVGRLWRSWRRRSGMGEGVLSQQPVDASDAAAVSVAALQIGAQFEAGDGAASAPRRRRNSSMTCWIWESVRRGGRAMFGS